MNRVATPDGHILRVATIHVVPQGSFRVCGPGPPPGTLRSHRLANVIDADRIFVLHDGVLQEQGTHAELITAGGRYATLFALQSSGYQPTPAVDTVAGG
jgi:hypothetical protein